MRYKLPTPSKKKIIETRDKKEAARYKKAGYSLRSTKSGTFVLKKRLKRWEYFQEVVATFLDALGFTDIEVGYSSWLGRYQIDVVAGYQGTLLVFECKSTGQPKLKKDLTKEINIFAGKRQEIEGAIKQKYGTKYNVVRMILALDDIEVPDKDMETAQQNDIFIWGNHYLKTGAKLFSIIGELTVHYVLKELGISPKPIQDDEGGSDYIVPCFRIDYDNQHIYSFFLPAYKLLNLVYVFRLQPGNVDAYQRFIKDKRIFGSKEDQGIAEFIRNGGFFKNTILCSFEKQVRFEKKSTGILLHSDNIEFGILSIPKLHGTVWIIDGQHRLYGYAAVDPSLRKTPIGVVAYQESEKQQQAKDFIDINQKQKPVDPNELWDLLSQVDPDSLDGSIAKLVKKLNNSGFFKNKILIPGRLLQSRKRYPLKLANISNSILDRKLLNKDGRDNLYSITKDVTDAIPYPESVITEAARILNEYFTILDGIAKDYPIWSKGFIIHNNGFNVFVRILSEILRYFKGKWAKQDVENLIKEPIKSYFVDKYEKISELRSSTSNESGRARVALDIIKYINQAESNFAREMIEDAIKKQKLVFEKSEPYQLLEKLENSLRKLIEEKLSKIDKNWWKSKVPLDVQEKAEKNRGRNNSPWWWTSPTEKSPLAYIEFADYIKIIQRSDNWSQVFKPIFKDQDYIVSKLKELQNIRNNIAHARSLSAHDATTLRLYTQKILNPIEVYQTGKS